MNIDAISIKTGAKVPAAIYTTLGEPVCVVNTMGERKDDPEVARRMVACWNSCKGIPTVAVEQISSLQVARMSYQAIQQQRAELLAAIDKAIALHDAGEDLQPINVLRQARDKVLGG